MACDIRLLGALVLSPYRAKLKPPLEVVVMTYLVQYLEVMPTFLILMGACWVITLILIGRVFEIVV